MEKELLKCLIDFYSKLESTDNKWKETVNSTERTIEALKNQAEQLHHVTSPEVDNAEICKIEGLRERLVFKIHAGIEDEIRHIQESVSRLNNNSHELITRLAKLEAARSKLSLAEESARELVDGTTHRPRLNLLLEWAIDGSDYYRTLYCAISESLRALDYKDEGSVERLAESFRERASARAKIDRESTDRRDARHMAHLAFHCRAHVGSVDTDLL